MENKTKKEKQRARNMISLTVSDDDVCQTPRVRFLPPKVFFFLAAAVAQVVVASLVVILETTEKHLPGKKRVITTKRLLTHSPRNDIIIRNVSKKLTRCLDEATSSTSFFFFLSFSCLVCAWTELITSEGLH